MHLPGFLNLDERNILPKDGVVSYFFPFYDELQSSFYFNELFEKVNWQQEQMNMYDRILPLPRLIAFYGKNSEWLPTLLEMKCDVEKHIQIKFNSVLLNLYRNQNDHVSWHSDRSSHPNEIKVIASLSFGEERKFQIKHKFDKSLDLISLNLKPGSLVVMKGIQENWLHRIAKTTKIKGPRINLTFRNIS